MPCTNAFEQTEILFMLKKLKQGQEKKAEKLSFSLIDVE